MQVWLPPKWKREIPQEKKNSIATLDILVSNPITLNRRIEHIQLLHQILFNQTKGVPRNQRKGFEKLIHILTYTTNVEFSETYRSFEIKDKIKKFNELNDFYLFDARKYKKANRRQKEFEELKKWYLQKEGRDFKIEEYIFLLEQNSSKKNKKRVSDYRNYLNNKKSYI